MPFLPDAPVLLAYALACLVLFITPGPDMSLFLAKTVTGGRTAGIAAFTGASLGCIVHSLLAAFGLSALIAASPTAFLALKIVGAVYLLWLAVDAVRNGSSLNVRAEPARRVAFWPTLALGLTVNLTNPKVVLFFVTFLPQFVPPGVPVLERSLLLGGIHVGMGFAWLCAYAALVGRFSALLGAGPGRRWLQAVTGTVLAGLGLRLAFERR
jgi:threonine/homoserine/homoserine lactone efflux protein